MVIRHGYQAWINAPSRKRSPELDFGCWWQMRPDRTSWRVSWIERTGELYAADGFHDRYIVLGHYPDREAVERAMSGWADPDSPIYRNLAALCRAMGVLEGRG